ncbi:sarcosine oxidase subunit gamma [Salinihabitans flavidus]|uniref:Sarcosine oxidase subunit gamma n=1 Tax=Salinihabitans flavidus TaxID=569882 RepID=A0A1H8P209_9RHOB|nr:sarcosine oxidase subunit gamma [Salinihabitans flavidus]SEO35814.1 sarcosine oxidase subunit gamma [Salinihabitans flavidus]
MAELIAKTPCAGLLPLEGGAVAVTEVVPEAMTLMAPFNGREAAFSDALKDAHGMATPAPKRATGREGARAVWFGRGQVMLIGARAQTALAGHAAQTDQSDAWAAVRIAGDDAEAVLARLVPMDLRQRVFKRGHTARTLLGHMTTSITRVGDDAFMILVFRSMAETLVHELQTAMKGVAGRRGA